MSENTSLETKPQETSNSPAPSNEGGNVNLNLSKTASVCAAGLFVSFFLPWINFLGLKASLFHAAKQGGENLLYLSLPSFCVLTIIGGVTGKGQKTAAQLAGAVPFFAVGHSLYTHGTDIMQIFGIGAWLGLGLGLVLFLLGRRLK